MKKIAVIFESSPFDRKGLFNAVHNRTKHLSASGEFAVDAYCMHIKDSFISRYLRKTEKVPNVESVEVEGIKYQMLWRRFSYFDEFRRRLAISPTKLISYASKQADGFKNYDILVAHSYEAGLVAYKAHKKYGIPYTVTWHGSDVHTHPINDPARRALTAQIMESASDNFFVSAALMAASAKITDAAPKSVLYNGVSETFRKCDEAQRQTLRANYGIGPNDKVVAYVGNFHPVKNVTILPELLSHVHDQFEMYLRDNTEYDYNLKFWMIGDGKLRAELQPEIMRAAGSDVRFWGNVPVERMPDMMNCIDVLLLPSRNEGLPLVVLEALKCGTSVLGSEVGGIPELIGKEFCVPFEIRHDGTADYSSAQFVDRLAQKTVKQLLYPKAQPFDPRFSWEESAKIEIGILKTLGR